MPSSHSWIVCETAGRWAAALRLAVARWQCAGADCVVLPRIHEVRSLADLEMGIKASSNAVGFVEVSNDNLALILEIFAKNARRNSRCVALLDSESSWQANSETPQPVNRESVADVLMEAGALCVVNSPRQIGSAIAIVTQYCTVRAAMAAPDGDESIAERAWASVPWQDA